MKGKLQKLATQLQGELYDDTTIRTLYATDASAYREMPLAVAIPKTKERGVSWVGLIITDRVVELIDRV